MVGKQISPILQLQATSPFHLVVKDKYVQVNNLVNFNYSLLSGAYHEHVMYMGCNRPFPRYSWFGEYRAKVACTYQSLVFNFDKTCSREIETIDSSRPVKPVRSTRIPVKAGKSLSYKHSVPLRQYDIMVTLKIVPGEIVPDRNILMITRDQKRPAPANIPSHLPYKQSSKSG